MSNDDTQNMVYLKIDIFNKNIVGIGNSIGTIDDVSIPIDTALTGVEELQRKIKAATGTFTGSPVKMGIKDALASGLLTGDAGIKITNLIKMLQSNVDIPSEIDGPGGLKEIVEASIQSQVNGGSNKLLDDSISFGGVTFGNRPNTKLGAEIYEEWIKKYKVKHPTMLEFITTNINSNLKTSMITYIDKLTTELDEQVAAIEAAPATEAATDAAPATEAATATDAYMNQLDGGKHTKRNKRNKHRKTKRRQSRNT